MAKQIYLICPVRNATPEQNAEMTSYVARLEAMGCEVHFPPRDVDQSNDDGGVRICKEHCHAMMNTDEVHVWLDEQMHMSQGSIFDLGMAFMFFLGNKGQINFKFVLANGPLGNSGEKSFENVLRYLVKETNSDAN